MEIFKDLKGYEEYYSVSNFGRIISKRKNREIKTFISNSGYRCFGVMVKGKRKSIFVHRAVAETFIENSLGLEQVNHIDENKLNNSVENLEWCTREYNNNYGTKIKRHKEKMRILFDNGFSQWGGKHHSEETKKKISESKSGKPLSEKQLNAIREFHKNNKLPRDKKGRIISKN